MGIIPKELFITDGTPEKYKKDIEEAIAGISDKKTIPVYFEPDAGKAQDIVRSVSHDGRGIILGAGWEQKLAEEKEYHYLPIAVPNSVRLVLTTNYVGFTGGLRLIEDIYNTVLTEY